MEFSRAREGMGEENLGAFIGRHSKERMLGNGVRRDTLEGVEAIHWSGEILNDERRGEALTPYFLYSCFCNWSP